MPTLQDNAHAPIAPVTPRAPSAIGNRLKRLAPSLARAAADTAGAFFCSPAAVGNPWDSPRVPDAQGLRCSQMNIGDKYEMLCNFSADEADWETLFPADVTGQIMLDAFCEMANCICGTLLADPDFSDEFGYLIPCVPCNGASRPASASSAMRGAFRVGSAWIRFSFAVQETAAILPEHARLNAAA
ncbi:MAG: hypothetical protein JWP91_2314 [Fibrobacteres bacterium]|nr:hypothetical protein [Fibrobacterota bacterium]